jgi:hypothetical protein
MSNVNRYILPSAGVPTFSASGLYSFNGSTFTNLSFGGSASRPQVCTYSPKLGRTVIATNGTTGTWAYTDNGTSVTTIGNFASTANVPMGLIWVDELDKFFASCNGTIRASSDGITWTSVHSGGGRFIAYSPSLGMLRASSAYSYDGVNWTSTSSIGASGTLEIHWCPDLGVFYCGDAISSDGINFTSVSGLSSYSSTWIPQQMSFFGLNASTNNSITRSQN